jgi:hypothetical protein
MYVDGRIVEKSAVYSDYAVSMFEKFNFFELLILF